MAKGAGGLLGGEGGDFFEGVGGLNPHGIFGVVEQVADGREGGPCFHAVSSAATTGTKGGFGKRAKT
jgi:hypothetical protein